VKNEITCVVFDIDDTLYLERDYVRSGFAAVGRWAEMQFGLQSLGERCWVAFQAGMRGRIFDVALSGYGDVDPELVPRFVERYRSHVPIISLLPDADRALRRLSGRYRLAALTDGPLESQRAKVRSLGLVGRLDPIVLTEELGPAAGKPAHDGFRVIERRVGTAGPACCYVGDNPAKDFRAPADLGWRTIRVRRPHALHHDEVSGSDVEAEVPDLGSLDELLEDLSVVRVSR
jgi:putative hydrolase of the HAD superfamily